MQRARRPVNAGGDRIAAIAARGAGWGERRFQLPLSGLEPDENRRRKIGIKRRFYVHVPNTA